MLMDLEDSANIYGVLPFEGGMLDQPEFIVEAFKIIRHSKAMYQEDWDEKQKKKDGS